MMIFSTFFEKALAFFQYLCYDTNCPFEPGTSIKRTFSSVG